MHFLYFWVVLKYSSLTYLLCLLTFVRSHSHQFKLERWMDYGPTIAAAFASPDVREVRDLRRCIIDIMRNCPQNPMLVQQQRAAANAQQAGRYGGAGAYAGGRNNNGQGGGGYGGPQPAPYQYPDERTTNGGERGGAHEGEPGGGESSARYQVRQSNSAPNQMGDDVSVLSGVVSEGVGYGFAESVSGAHPPPQHQRQASGMTWQNPGYSSIGGP